MKHDTGPDQGWRGKPRTHHETDLPDDDAASLDEQIALSHEWAVRSSPSRQAAGHRDAAETHHCHADRQRFKAEVAREQADRKNT